MYLEGMCIYIYVSQKNGDISWQGAVGFLNCQVSFEENPVFVELICKRPGLYMCIADKESYHVYACGK